LPDKPIIETGDKLKLVSDGTTLTPTVLVRQTFPSDNLASLTPIQENSSKAFQWRGSFYGLLIGTHTFRFEPSTTTPGATTFVQDEEFTGVLSILFFGGSAMRKKTQNQFDTFNSDLKAWVEGQSRG
jgi:hypothetical protein